MSDVKYLVDMVRYKIQTLRQPYANSTPTLRHSGLFAAQLKTMKIRGHATRFWEAGWALIIAWYACLVHTPHTHTHIYIYIYIIFEQTTWWTEAGHCSHRAGTHLHTESPKFLKMGSRRLRDSSPYENPTPTLRQLYAQARSSSSDFLGWL